MDMFVANATKMEYDFVYRVPESSGLRSQKIPVGGQVKLSGNLSVADIDSIIEQQSRYGMIAADAIDRSKDFSGLCYSVDKPVQSPKIERLMHHNTRELVKMGQKIRQEAAISSSNVLENQLDESGRPEALRNFEMSVVEENHDDRDENPAIAEGIRVRRDEPAPRGRGRPRKS